jgi:hypothetical protein
MVYFKVAAIILSSNIKYICGYKTAIFNICAYIECTKSTVSCMKVTSLGKHKIPLKVTRTQFDVKTFVAKETDESADSEKYFIALKM